AYVRRVLAALGAAPSPAAAPALIASPPARPALAPTGRTILIDGVIESLTNREMDVLLLLAQRLSDKEIAERLVLAPVTVKKHTLHIYQKLGVNNRRAAAEMARQLGLV
ncbi:MAG: LuxR C-terminal-related transcriptional regulator, partial [Anaerolineae bacterium]